LLVLAILFSSVGFFGWLGWGLWQRWRYQRWLDRLPKMERLYQQFLLCLQKQGFAKHPTQTPLEYGDELQQYLPSPLLPSAQRFLQSYVAWRYGKKEPDLPSLELIVQQFQRHYRRVPA
jgi:hypothetical protein